MRRHSTSSASPSPLRVPPISSFLNLSFMPSTPLNPAARVVKVMSSFGLATTVLALLLLVTFLGTLEQVEHGLFDSQKKYFESWWITGIDVGCCLRAMHFPPTAKGVYNGAFHLPIIMP